MSRLHQGFFLRWVLAVGCLACVPKSFASTKSCGDLFPRDQGSAPKLSSEDFVEFQKAAHDFFTATLTEVSDRTPTEEKGIHFSKLAAFAKKHNLSPKDFEALRDQSKMDFIRENFMEYQSGGKIISMDPQKVKKLNSSAVRMKLSLMQEYHSSQEFIAELDKQNQLSLQDINFERLLFEKSFKDTDIMKILDDMKNFDKPYFRYILPNNQNTNFQQVIFGYISKSAEIFQLWTLQEKIISIPDGKNALESWKIIAYQILPKKENPVFYLYLFPFYSPETNKIILATFHHPIYTILQIDFYIDQFEWLSLDIYPDSEIKSILPTISLREQSVFAEKINTHIKNSTLRFLGLLFSEKTRSFYFANGDSISQKDFIVELNHISSIEKEDFKYTDTFSFLFPEGNTYITKLSLSFAEDGRFVKIKPYAKLIASAVPLNSTTLPLPSAEDKYFEQTRYLFPTSIFQIQTNKSRFK